MAFDLNKVFDKKLLRCWHYLKYNNLPSDLSEEIKLSLDDQTSQESLEQLSNSSDELVRVIVAGNKNTPSTILESLSSSENFCVLYKVAQNPNTPEHVLINLSTSSGGIVFNALAENKNTPENVLRCLFNIQDKTINNILARNINSPVDILVKLSETANYHTLCSLSQNKSTPTEVLLKMIMNNYDDNICQNFKWSAYNMLKSRNLTNEEKTDIITKLLEYHLQNTPTNGYYNKQFELLNLTMT